jgi:hypothetical protein
MIVELEKIHSWRCELKSQELSTERATEVREDMRDTVSELYRKIPQLNVYLQRGLPNSIIKPAGLSLLLSVYYQKKDSDFTPLICPNLSSFSKELVSVKKNKKQSFMVRATSSAHITAVHVHHKESGEVSIVITDSFGKKLFTPSNSVYLLWEAIQRSCLAKKKIYISQIIRQNDNTNCPVYSMQDCLFVHRNGLDIDSLESFPTEFDDTFYFTLPEAMNSYSTRISDIFLRYQEVILRHLLPKP